MGGFWEGFEGDLIGFWAVAAELLAVACFYLLLLTFACFGLLWLALPALAALSVPLLLRFMGLLWLIFRSCGSFFRLFYAS